MLPRSFTARARKGELRMKKFLLLFAGALMLLSGCSTSEIGERAIIQAARRRLRRGIYRERTAVQLRRRERRACERRR